MSHEALERLRRWLADEQSGEADAADEAFRQVFRLVPRVEPTRPLRERVLAAIWAAGGPGGAKREGWLVLRPIVTVSLLLSGLAMLSVSDSLPALPIGSAVNTGVALFAAVSGCVGRAAQAGLAVWRLLSDVGLAARAVVGTPPVGVAVALSAALALASFLGLRRVMTPLEEPR